MGSSRRHAPLTIDEAVPEKIMGLLTGGLYLGADTVFRKGERVQVRGDVKILLLHLVTFCKW